MIIDSGIKYIKILAGIWIAAFILSRVFHIPTENTVFGLIIGIPLVGALSLGGFVLSGYYKDTRKVLSSILRLAAILFILGSIAVFFVFLAGLTI